MGRFYSTTEVEVPVRLRPAGVTAKSAMPLNAAGEAVHQSGYLELEDPFGGSKTISAAGGGSIVWLTHTSLTWADVGTNLRVGLQDMSTATNPGQGDGTFDVYADLVPGTDTITSDAINEHVMGSGTKTMSQGDHFTFAIDMTARAGSDQVRVAAQSVHRGLSHNSPIVSYDSTGSAFARQGSMPVMQIVFDDGTKGWIKHTALWDGTGTIAPHVNTGTADEYGNTLTLTSGSYLVGFALSPGYISNVTGSMECILYSDPLGTPVAEHVVTVDYHTIAPIFTSGELLIQIAPAWLSAGTYGVAIRPTTTQTVTLQWYDSDTALHLDQFGGVDMYAIRRLDNTGAFSDYNGGTAKTRRMEICALMAGGEIPNGRSRNHIGV